MGENGSNWVSTPIHRAKRRSNDGCGDRTTRRGSRGPQATQRRRQDWASLRLSGIDHRVRVAVRRPYGGAGRGPRSDNLLVLGAIIMIILALVHAELGSMYPVAGGSARYPHF